MDRVDALADALSRALQRLLRLRGPVGDAEVVPLLRVVLARRGTAEKLLEILEEELARGRPKRTGVNRCHR
jgi:hypothetical protein